jgi:hypothetical protein
MSWPIRVTSRRVYAVANGPDEKGALSGEMILLPEKTNIRLVSRVDYDERFGSRWLGKTTGKYAGQEKDENDCAVLRQWWCYVGKDDLEVESKIPIVDENETK